MITWPAIVKFRGDHELVYVNSLVDWESNYDLPSYRFEVGDCLIDSTGKSYNLEYGAKVDQIVSQSVLSLDEITELVRHHASELGNCCISKLVFPSIAAAVKGVATIKDEH